MGFRSKEYVNAFSMFNKRSDVTWIATDDGSFGSHGTAVAEFFRDYKMQGRMLFSPVGRLLCCVRSNPDCRSAGSTCLVMFRWRNGWGAASAPVSSVFVKELVRKRMCASVKTALSLISKRWNSNGEFKGRFVWSGI